MLMSFQQACVIETQSAAWTVTHTFHDVYLEYLSSLVTLHSRAASHGRPQFEVFPNSLNIKPYAKCDPKMLTCFSRL